MLYSTQKIRSVWVGQKARKLWLLLYDKVLHICSSDLAWSMWVTVPKLSIASEWCQDLEFKSLQLIWFCAGITLHEFVLNFKARLL